MSIFDDDRPKKMAVHEIGCDLSQMSADELSHRISLLHKEIERIETERQLKNAGKQAAENFFKR